MFTIKNKSYTIEELKFTAQNQSEFVDLDEWESSFWNFLSQWFNPNKKSIEIKTSGSTGEPKIISHSKKYMLASATMTCNFFQLDHSKTALLCLPTTSVGGIMMVVRALVSEMNLIVQKPSSNPLKNVNESLDFVAMVPMQVQKSLTESKEKWAFVKTVIIGGGKVSVSLGKDLLNNKINAFSTFGMTETISHVALKKIGENIIFSALPSCVFSVNEHNCLIIDAKNIGVENLQTNDVVNLINETQFEWLGRLDNAIETGGVKVLPEKIEEKIAHLFRSKFFISSLPDKLLNNKLVLFIEGNEMNIDLADLKPFLSLYEIPKEIFYMKKFKETKTGKFSRKLTKEKFIQNK